jgi:hypothetical protein
MPRQRISLHNRVILPHTPYTSSFLLFSRLLPSLLSIVASGVDAVRWLVAWFIDMTPKRSKLAY